MTSQAFDETMVAVTAAEMRRTLGLVPWPAFEIEARERLRRYLAAGGFPDPDPNRGSGRTTRDALAALARCQVLGLSSIHVAGDRSVVRRVKDLVRTLGLGIDVLDGDPDRCRGRPGGTWFLVDHHEAARRRGR
jgi:hypothetical protein